jgi:hypothetical protein
MSNDRLGPPCNREHGPNPYIPDTFLHAHWELHRSVRDLGRAILRFARLLSDMPTNGKGQR